MSQILNEFLKIYSVDNIQLTAIVFVVSFIIYEIPDILRVLRPDDEHESYEEDLGPGRILNGILFILGLATIIFLYFGGNLSNIIGFTRNQSIGVPLLIALVSVAIIAFFAFFKKVIALVDKDTPFGKLIKETIFELGKTVFYISFAIMVLPAVLFLLLGS